MSRALRGYLETRSGMPHVSDEERGLTSTFWEGVRILARNQPLSASRGRGGPNTLDRFVVQTQRSLLPSSKSASESDAPRPGGNEGVPSSAAEA